MSRLLVCFSFLFFTLTGYTKDFTASPLNGEASLSVTFQVSEIKKAVSYIWTFDDGQSAITTAPSTIHIYTAPGTYTATLDYADSKGKKLKKAGSETITVIAKLNAAPTASLSCSNSNLLVSCSGLASHDPEGKALTYRFDYGDGFVESNSTGSSSHAYAQPGTFTVTLKVTDIGGAFGQTTTPVSPVLPTNLKPIPELHCSSDRPFVLTCDAQGSTDPDGQIVSYLYTWDQGTSNQKTDNGVITHTFSTGGSHTISLMATDNGGDTTTITQTFGVKENNAPIVDFSCIPNFQNLKIKCISSAHEDDVGDSIADLHWKYGDGVEESGVSTATHLYNVPNTYTVTLEATDSFGLKGSKTKTFAIVDASSPHITFQYPTGHIFSISSAQTFVISVSEEEMINSSRVILMVGDSVVPANYYSIDSTNNVISVNFPRGSYLRSGSNVITMTVSFTNGNSATEVVSYNVTDNVAPTISVSPTPGTHFSSDNGEIILSLDDASGIDWTSLTLNLRGAALSSTLYKREGNTIVINVSSGDVLEPEDNDFSLTIKDKSGNTATSNFTFFFDPSTLNFDFLTETDSKIDSSGQEVSIYPVSQDGSVINWSSLKVFWNGVELPSGGYSVTNEKISVPLDFSTSNEGVLKISMQDSTGQIVTGESVYSLKDSVPPVVGFSIADGSVIANSVAPDLSITLSDDSLIDEDTLNVNLNGVQLPSSEYIFDPQTKTVTLKLSPAYSAMVGDNNLSLSVKDLEGNLSQKTLNFKVTDSEGPTVIFTPQVGSSFLSNYNTVSFKVHDLSQVNWQSLRMDLNGIPVPLIYFTISDGSVVINFNPDFSFELGENFVNVSISDLWGNTSTIAANYYLLETRTPLISYSPDRGTTFKALPQNIVAKFNYPAEINWSTVNIKLNNIVTTAWSKTSTDEITLNLSASLNYVQGLNLINISYKDLEGNDSNEVVTYFIDDLYQPVIALNPADGQIFSTQKVKLLFSGSDASGINWQTLIFKLNGTNLTNDKYSVNGNEGQVNFVLVPGLNAVEMSVQDNSGKESVLNRSYTLLDVIGPTYKFSPTNWSEFALNSPQSFVISLSDESGVKPSSIQVWLNSILLSSDSYSWSQESSSVSVALTSSVRLKGGNNTIRIKASDNLDHFSESNVTYKLIDNKAPALTFFPISGSNFADNKSPGIKVSFSDDSVVDFSSAIFYLNSTKIDSSDILIDVSNSYALITLSNLSLKLGGNELKVEIKDSFNNSSVTTAQYTLVDTLAPEVTFSPANDTQFNTVDQAISLTFTDLTDIDWQTLIIKLNGDAVPTSQILRTNSNVMINFSKSYPLEAGDNEVEVSLKDVSGNELESSVNYKMEDIFPAKFTFAPSSGTTLNDLATPITVSISDSAGLNWTSLSIKLNGTTLPASQYSVSGSMVTINSSGAYMLHKGLNLVEVQITDESGNQGIASASYLLIPEQSDSLRPVIGFSLPNGKISIAPTKITVSFSDASGMDFSRIKILMNNVIVGPDNLNILRDLSKVEILFDQNVKFNFGSNIVTVYATDNQNNLSAKSAYYELVDILGSDSRSPIVTFLPHGGELVNNQPTIMAFLSDESGIDYSHIEILLNDAAIDPSIVTVDQVQGKIALVFNAAYPLPALASNKITVNVSDALGNMASASVGFDRLEDTKFRIVTSGVTTNSGHRNVCAILEGGLLHCWGANLEGQAGLGITGSIGRFQTPASVPYVQTGEPVYSVIVGIHVCALTVTGKVLCWGENQGGGLGYGHTNNIGDNELPISQGYVDIGEKVTQLSTGADHTCALLESGNIKCWGSNVFGQIGRLTSETIGDNELPSSIPSISFGQKVKQVVCSANNTCVVLLDGTVKCFGEGNRGVNGRALTAHTLGLNPVNLANVALSGTVRELASNSNANHVCALLNDGRVNCWGLAANGRLGYGNLNPVGDNETPASVGTVSLGGFVKKVSVGSRHTCALMSSGEVRCWGQGDFQENGYTFDIGDNELPSSVAALNFGTGTVSDLILGLEYTCLVFEAGNMKCWGLNSSGELGQSQIAASLAFSTVPSMAPIVLGGNILLGQNESEITDPQTASGGSLYNCSILVGGYLRCWGSFQGTVVGRTNFPSDVPFVNIGEPVASISIGLSSCAITYHGKLLCWGVNDSGQLGYGHTSLVKENVVASQGYVNVGENVMQVSVGNLHTCALLESGNIKCWGANAAGQTGRLTTETIGDNELPSSIPSISFGVKVKKIATSANNTCVLLETGKVRCFGEGFRGVNGQGVNTATLGLSPSSLPDISLNGLAKDIITSQQSSFVCAILTDGQINCWGSNTTGQLGYGNLQNVGDNETPSSKGTVSLGGTVEKLTLGSTHACALLTSGDVRCWGNSAFEENGFTFVVGDNELPSSVPVLNYGAGVVVDLSAGLGFSCLIFNDGTEKCWGRNDTGTIGQKSTLAIISASSLPTLPPISLGGQVVLEGDQLEEPGYDPVASSGANFCSILEGGLLRCWGANVSGNAGLAIFGSIGKLQYPSDVPFVQTGEPVTQVVTGNTVCALTINGKLLCWGNNTTGALGYGHTNNIGDNELPITQGYVDVGEKVVQVSTGSFHTCAVLESGNLKCWGLNSSGQLGQISSETIGDNELPSSIPSISFGAKVIKVACTQLDTCVLLETGKVKCFGQGFRGATGLGVSTDTLGTYAAALPDVSLNGLVREIAGNSNGQNFCAILTDDRLNCWGSNTVGQLGYGNTQNVGDNELPSSKGTVSLNGFVKKIAVGTNHACALLTSGSVQCWGNSAFEENGFNFNVGDNELPSSVPVLNYGAGVVIDVTAGLNTSCLIFDDGTEKCWGNNTNGQAGQKSTSTLISAASLPTLPPISLGGKILSEQEVYAFFVISSYFGPSPLLVHFDATLSRIFAGTISNYHFDFGDGEVLDTTNPIVDHFYNEDGVYQTTLTIQNSNNKISTFKRTITVGPTNNPPFANFQILNDFGSAPFIAQFDASSSFDSNGVIAKYLWDFGDGVTLMTTSASINHTYLQAGVYLSTLKVEDDNQAQVEAFPQVLTVKELNMSPFASFDCVNKDNSLSCNAYSSGDMDGYITSYKWDLGAGLIVEGQDKAAINVNYAFNGTFTVKLTVIDDSGASSTLFKDFSIDTTAPLISATGVDHIYSSENSFLLNISIQDSSVTETKVYRNSDLILTTLAQTISETVTLSEGTNTFRVECVDQAGNASSKLIFSDIVLDSTPPALATISPEENAGISTQSALIKGSFNEKVTNVTIEGNPVVLGSDQQTFTYNYNSFTEGEQDISIHATDLAGNTFSHTHRFSILLRILNPELIATFQQPDQTLKVVGYPGAAKAGIDVEVSAGFFNSGSTVAQPDGSFEVSLRYFTSAQVVVTDHETNRTDVAELKYNVDTTLAGTIQDTDGNPIPGVKVQIKDTNSAYVVTNSAGIFSIPNPPSGDQQLVINGQNIPETIIGSNKKFSILEFPVIISSRQSNVLDRIIYLTPLMLDGTETSIADGVGTIVNSSNVGGVSINIPAHVQVNFPVGSTARAINIIGVPKSRTTVPVLKEAEPDNVYAFEPSGLSFSEPVQLTLPNENQFPPKMQVVIYSNNSQTGTWEIDGIARVSDSGNEIVTEEGMGITHFSQVYAAPIGLKYTQVNAQDRSGINTTDGSLSTSIQLPGYKSVGTEIAPKILYKSNWAHPTAVVTNVFEISDEVSFFTSDGRRVLEHTKGIKAQTWVVPESVDVNFMTGDYQSPNMTFKGLPNKGVISLGIDFANQKTGVTPFKANYEVHLKNMVMRMGVSLGDFLNPFSLIFRKPKEYDLTIPSELKGHVYIQNKSESNVGRGWMIGGIQKIFNPLSSKIMLEEGNGTISSYVAFDKIQTLTKIDEGFSGISQMRPGQLAISSEGNNVYQLDLHTNILSTLLSAPKYNGVYKSSAVARRKVCDIWGKTGLGKNFCLTLRTVHYCLQQASDYVLNPTRKYLLPSPAGNGNILASEAGSISIHGGSTQILTGFLKDAPTADTDPTFCSTTGSCTNQKTISDIKSDSCSVNSTSTGKSYDRGYADGPLEVSKFNTIKSVASSLTQNGFAVADYGNHSIRFVNLDTNTVATIAGNRKAEDTGMGGNALDAGLSHPRGLVYDEDGNLFISTESGYIRKLDKFGNISQFAGSAENVIFEDTTAMKMGFNNPYGLAIDHVQSYLYVADTGNHRIVRIDLITNEARTVVGNGLCQTESEDQENGLALNASLCSPEFVAVDENHNLIIADTGHKKIRRVIFSDSSDGVIKFDSVAEDNSTLYKNNDGSFLRKMRNGSQFVFDSAGNHKSTRDLAGRVSTNEYDSLGNLIEQIDPVGGVINYMYGASGGKLNTIRYENDQREFHFNYNGVGDLTSVSYPDGTTKNYVYESDGIMSQEFDQRNFKTSYSYNEWKRLAMVTRPDNKQLIFIDSQSNSMANNFIGGVVGQFKTFGSDANQLVDGIKDAKNITTTFVKDETGFISTIIDGDNRITSVERDKKGRPTKITRPDLSAITYVYDNLFGDLLSKADMSTGTTETYRYNEFGQLTFKQDGLGRILKSDYDSRGLLTSNTNEALGTGETYSYNNLGLPITQTNALGQIYNMTYNDRGNLQTSISPDGKETNITYYPSGLTNQIIDANNHSKFHIFDSMNRLVSVTDANNKTTQFTYFETGELKDIIDANNNETHFFYDSLGQLTKKIGTQGDIMELAYDPNGNLAQEKIPTGEIKQYEYDNLNQLTRKILPEDQFNYEYDVRGSLTNVSNSTTQIEFEYQHFDGGDVVSRVHSRGIGTRTDLPDTVLVYTYNEIGEKIQTTTPLGSFTYDRDAAGRLHTLTNNEGKKFNFSYDLNQRLTLISGPSVVTSFEFDTGGFNTKIKHSRSSGANIEQFIYGRDSLGNTVSKSTSYGTSTYSYNQLDQIIQAATPGLPIENYVYDSIGNRTSDNQSTYLYDTTKQILQEDSKFIYGYDLNGNQISKQEKGFTGNAENFEYSSENQLVKFKKYDNGILVQDVLYTYDALGNRIEKVVNNNLDNSKSFSRKYVYDGDSILIEYDSSGVPSLYTHSTLKIDDPLAVTKGNKTFYFVKDALGTITDITDSQGQIVQHHEYTSFGKLTKISSLGGADITDNPELEPFFTYTGREFDRETGLYYYRARYYDPSIGRFISEDPNPGVLSLPNTFTSRYAYVGNNPINFKDPKGEFFFAPVLWIALEGALYGALAGFALGLVNSNGNFDKALSTAFTGAFVGAGAALGSAFVAASLTAGGIDGFGLFIGKVLGAGIGGGFFGGLTGLSFEEGFIGGATGQAVGSSGEFLGEGSVGTTGDPEIAPPPKAKPAKQKPQKLPRFNKGLM